MAKSKKIVNKPRRRRVKTVISHHGREAYKRLLVDPCYAELPQSPYESNGGAIIGRVRSTSLGPGLATDTGMVVFYHPVFGAFSREAASPGSTGSLKQYSTFYQPVGNTNAARAIAGCLSVTYIGAESSRSGVMHCGIVSGALVATILESAAGGQGISASFTSLAAGLSHMERTPVDKCEVNWVPGEGDQSFAAMSPALASASQLEVLFEKTNFCVIIVTGLPAAANTLEWNATGVVETVPAATNSLFNNSIAFDVATSTRPRFDYRDVVRELGAKDPSWFIGTFKKAWKFVGGVAKGYATAGLPGALGYLIGASPSDNVGSRSYIKSNR